MYAKACVEGKRLKASDSSGSILEFKCSTDFYLMGEKNRDKKVQNAQNPNFTSKTIFQKKTKRRKEERFFQGFSSYLISLPLD